MSKEKYLKEYDPSFTPRLVMEEASRCLLCLDAPCSSHCPAGTDPAKFIRSLRFKNVKGAAETIRTNNVLGSVCARVCPTEHYCQAGCSRSGIDKPIDIGRIQRYITDFEEKTKMNILECKEKNGVNISIIGSGPSGLTAAAHLAMEGYNVTIYEKEKLPGGYLRYGIPEYRLPNEVVDTEIKRIKKLGVNIICNTKIGVDISIEELKSSSSAMIFAIGHQTSKILPMFLDSKKVISAIDLLKKIKTKKGEVKLPNNILVIGGGDVAMDVVTSLKLLGVQHVTDVVYETFAEFKASNKELKGAQEQGVSIIDGYFPTKYQRGGIVTFKHRFIESELKIKTDLVVLAIGQTHNSEGLGLEYDKNEVIYDNYQIKDSNLFFAGDIAHGDKTVVHAVKTGKEVAAQVISFLGGSK